MWELSVSSSSHDQSLNRGERDSDSHTWMRNARDLGMASSKWVCMACQFICLAPMLIIGNPSVMDLQASGISPDALQVYMA